jgi:uncharacterized protein
MKLENEFTVPAPVSAAWDVLLDVERVAPCLPGATLEGERDGEYAGTMKIKIGPITTSYKGTVKIEEADEAAHRAVMRAQARDSRGQGTAAATITSTMQEVDGGTRVHVETDMRITGPAAQFGRGVMQDVSAKLMGRFADCLAAEITGGGTAQTGAETVGGPAAEEGGGAATTAPAETPAPTPSLPADARVAGPFNPAADPPPGPAGESAEAAARPTPAVKPRPSEEVLDLGEASREAVLKRVVPVAAAMGVLILFLGIRRRLR